MADGSIVPRVTVVVSLLALAGSSVAVAARFGARRQPASVAGAGAAGADDEDVERRVSRQERQVELLRVGLATRAATSGPGSAHVAPTVSGGAGTVSAAEAADLGQRLARLEQLAANIQASHGGAAHPLTPEAMAAATHTVLD